MTTVLVVDDSLTVRMELTEALESAGLRVVGVATLGAARRELAAQPIDLAILDVNLPDGNGTDLLAWMRTQPQFYELPVLVLSTEADVKDRVRGLRIGASDYIGKPYDTASVIARVRQLTEVERSPRRTILVVDDSPTARMTLVSGLEGRGYATLHAADGHEGLQIAARERPSAIIVDGMMPDMDGATLIRCIRLDPALRTTPCLMITGSDGSSDEVEALEAGADAFARKDADLDIVMARLAAMMRSAEEVPATSASLSAPKRILVVDGDREFRDKVADVLHDSGYDVAQTASSHEAVDLVSVQRVDCILLAWSVESASATCTRIKAAPTVRETPLIVVTDDDDRAQMLEALAAGADDAVAKTAGLALLAARVRAQIRRREFEDERRRAREQLVRSELLSQLERANSQLTSANEELEAFSYSVSHDLRAPLRAIGSFSAAVLEDAGPALDENNREYLHRVVRAAATMADMIEALLELSRASRAAITRECVDLSATAASLLGDLAARDPTRAVTTRVAANLTTTADPRLVRVAFDNLLNNAWKFTSQREDAQIDVGSETRDGTPVYFVRDNGAGFDAAQAGTQLFHAFKRLHTEKQFAGTGIGLATTRRIVERHGGKIWAESLPGNGATFYLTFGPS